MDVSFGQATVAFQLRAGWGICLLLMNLVDRCQGQPLTHQAQRCALGIEIPHRNNRDIQADLICSIKGQSRNQRRPVTGFLCKGVSRCITGSAREINTVRLPRLRPHAPHSASDSAGACAPPDRPRACPPGSPERNGTPTSVVGPVRGGSRRLQPRRQVSGDHRATKMACTIAKVVSLVHMSRAKLLSIFIPSKGNRRK